MKQIILPIMAVSMLFISMLTSCKKSDKDTNTPYVCATCSSTPQGNPMYDNSANGLYKGIVIGSSGTIKFDINNSANAIIATLVIDGDSAVLISQISAPPTGTYVSPFFGTMNGQPVSITFEVNFDGSSPTITSSNIPGHPNATFIIAKETSTVVVRCFEGTYSNSHNENGTFNIIVSTILKGWQGIYKESGTNNTTNISGSYVNNILYWGAGTTTEIATINGDTFSGTFNDGSADVTVVGQRKL